MTTAALAIAFGSVELVVGQRREHGFVVDYRSAFRYEDDPVRVGRRLLDTVQAARSRGARDVSAVVVANGRSTATAARLALAAGAEVRLLRGGDERALVFAGATTGRIPDEKVVVCAIEDGLVDVIAGSVGSGPRWAASIVAAHGRSLPLGETLRRLAKLVDRLQLPRDGACLLTGSGARSLRLALAARPESSVRGIVERIERSPFPDLAHTLGVSPRRAQRIAVAATLTDALAKATRVTPELVTGGLLEGALLVPTGIATHLARREPLDRASLLLGAGSDR
jgi:hypothetical protein